MAELCVIVPTRGRPHNLARLVDVWASTADPETQTVLLVVVDADDPTVPDYREAVASVGFARLAVDPGPRQPGMVAALNRAAVGSVDRFRLLGFMGDDHLPITPNWDRRIRDQLASTWAGMVYGDDLLQRAALPTAIFLTANIVRRLGWMAPPMLRHLYVDNAWRDLGLAAGILSYLDDVVIEHVHPVAQKAAWDDGYARVNHPSLDAVDRAAFTAWRHSPAFTEAVWALQQLAHPETPEVVAGG